MGFMSSGMQKLAKRLPKYVWLATKPWRNQYLKAEKRRNSQPRTLVRNEKGLRRKVRKTVCSGKKEGSSKSRALEHGQNTAESERWEWSTGFGKMEPLVTDETRAAEEWMEVLRSFACEEVGNGQLFEYVDPKRVSLWKSQVVFICWWERCRRGKRVNDVREVLENSGNRHGSRVKMVYSLRVWKKKDAS